MIYAIVQLGSRQYKVSQGDSIDTALIHDKEGASVTWDKVLLFANGSTVKVGQPYVKGIKVTAKVIRHFKADKVISFKYRRRKDSLWKKGHRQRLTTLNITKIATDK